MFQKIKQWREKRILANSPYTTQTWQQTKKELEVLNLLDETQQSRLYEQATLFLHKKDVTGRKVSR